MYIRFSQKLVGVLGQEETLPWARQCNKLHSTICIVLLSEFVSQNAWLQHYRQINSLLQSEICCNVFAKILLSQELLPTNDKCGRATKADLCLEDLELFEESWPCPNFTELYCSLRQIYPTFPPFLLATGFNLQHSLLTLPVFCDCPPLISFQTGASLIKFFHILSCFLKENRSIYHAIVKLKGKQEEKLGARGSWNA